MTAAHRTPTTPTASATHIFPPPPVVDIPVTGSARRFAVRRVYCVGRNYAEHAKEMGHTGRELPFFFMKPADAILPVAPGHTGVMHYPSLTQNLHHEVELVVAIGQGGQHIAPEQALRHVFGYAVGLDMTRRDLQTDMKAQGRPWCIGKAFDESAPIGAITPASEVPAIGSAAIALSVNGTLRQASHIHRLIWNVAETIAHLSAAWALQPGDLIFTGTPEGVAAVQRGDSLHASIDGLSSLSLTIA